jgi:Family of unknown function (DUF6454)
MRCVTGWSKGAVRSWWGKGGVVALAVGMGAMLVVSVVGSAPSSSAGVTDPLVAAVQQLSRSTVWTTARSMPLSFLTYHPQGLARVGDRLFLSSVEVIEAPVRYPQPIDGYDRSPGRGVGHLFELDLNGRLLRQIILGEGTIYHPGGIDFDGRDLWVPVAEYRPNSRAIVYRVDPGTLAATEAFRVADHVGGVVHPGEHGPVYGVSWGSRRLYAWTENGHLLHRAANESHYVDFQDCASAGDEQAVCTGITEFPTASGGRFDLGGIAVLDLRTLTVGHEVPVTVLSPNRHVVTRNPVLLETDGPILRMWAAPDDGEEPGGTTLLVLEATLH